MKKIAILILLHFTINSFSQNKTDYQFGEISNEEINLKKYALDTTANALVLFESGNSNFDFNDKNIIIRTKYYYKIKLFNKEGFNQATFSIPLQYNKKDSESVKDINAVTHNNLNKTILAKDQIFTENVNDRWKEVKFTMPNLKEGSIIEVEYTLESPFKFNLTGWEFQTDIPKMFSQYKASIPGNYVYNRKLSGYLKLKTNLSTTKTNCFHVPAYAGYANCEELTYAMENIPAFVEEDYMNNKENFISKIKFELAEFKWFDGSHEKYTTTWKAVDQEFKTDKNIGIQLKKSKYFEEFIPLEIKSNTNDLEKAKAVYTYIQNHFTWNKKYSIFNDVNVKEAFENKVGNVGEINISLINTLKAVGLNAEMVLLSTRNNGFPTKIHPVISDFNYIIAKVTINDKFYLLDATEKLAPFGLLPFRCLNGYGRVMDFENESYWLDIIPENDSKTRLYVALTLNPDGSFKGKLRRVNDGYNALLRREFVLNKSNNDLILEFENQFNTIEVLNYQIENRDDIDKPIVEIYEIFIENIDKANKFYLNPFFGELLKNNPFKQENRLYPVDFGYPKNFIVNFSLEIPDNYNIESYPESKNIVLEKGDGRFTLITKKSENHTFTLNSSLAINKPVFYNFEYEPLKMLFNHAISSQKVPIVLKKN
ncbi:MAG: transglutaminase domain-containing protein [Lutibacter sp.]|jgi:hypothetical protein